MENGVVRGVDGREGVERLCEWISVGVWAHNSAASSSYVSPASRPFSLSCLRDHLSPRPSPYNRCPFHVIFQVSFILVIHLFLIIPFQFILFCFLLVGFQVVTWRSEVHRYPETKGLTLFLHYYYYCFLPS